MALKFKTQYTGSTTKPEKNFGERLVETAGYIPAQVRIENMMLAGRRLAEARKELYDFPAGVEPDENLSDPTRSPNFDMADATAIQMAAESRLRQSRKAVEPSEPPRKAVEPSEFPRKAVEPSEPLSPVEGEPAPKP